VLSLFLSYFFLSKSISKKLERYMYDVQLDLQRRNIDQAIVKLFFLKRQFGKWQFFINSSIDGQIGSIYYIQSNYIKAEPYLKKSFSRHWIAKSMLGILYYRKKEYNNMDKIFESAVRYSSKQGLLWSVWAYCLVKSRKNNQAINVLLRAKNKLGNSDLRITQNLINLQNKKKMKMRSYGEQWYQFQLEVSPQLRQMQNKSIRFSRR
jgi:hypothetical protein